MGHAPEKKKQYFKSFVKYSRNKCIKKREFVRYLNRLPGPAAAPTADASEEAEEDEEDERREDVEDGTSPLGPSNEDT